MNKQEAQQLEKAVESAKLAEVGISQPEQMKEQPLGFDFKKDGIVILDRNSYLMLVNILKPFQYACSVLDVAKDNAVRQGQILPFYEKDVIETQKNEAGQVVNYILREDFGVSEKKTNEISLVDVNGSNLKTAKSN